MSEDQAETHSMQLSERSEEIIKQLNRLANDRTINMQARNRIRNAAQHIREMQDTMQASETYDVDSALDIDL